MGRYMTKKQNLKICYQLEQEEVGAHLMLCHMDSPNEEFQNGTEEERE
jgi:hypothetical protein